MTSSQTWECPSELREQLYELYGLTCPPAYGPLRRPHFPTFGPRIQAVMAALGTPPMPWQRYATDVLGEVNPATGVLAYGRGGLSVMRQQGKTAIVFGEVTWRARAWPRQRIAYAAQTGSAAGERWQQEVLPTLLASPFKDTFKERRTKGSLGLDWDNGSITNLISSSETAGHGPPLDLGCIDEYFAHRDKRTEQAMAPAMITRPMSQLIWASAGGTELSVPLNDARARGRALWQTWWRARMNGEDLPWPTSLYLEWFAPDHLPREAESTWFACMPALCPAPPCRCDPERRWRHTVTADKVRAELDDMDTADFDRSMLNRTKRSTPPVDPNVPTEAWPTCVDVRSRRGPELAFAIDCTPLRDWTAIGVYSPRPDGLAHIEVVDMRPGSDWAVGAMLRLRELWNPVAIGLDIKGPAGGLLRPLEDAGIKRPEREEDAKRGQLYVPTASEVATACGDIAEDVRTRRVRHIDQAPLNIAIEGTQSRPLGDAFAWARRTSGSNIGPWCSVTLARQTYHVRAGVVLNRGNPVDNIW